MRRTIPFLLFPALLIVACDAGVEEQGMAEGAAEQPATPAMEPAATQADVDQVRDAWVDGALAGDAAAVASLYSTDAVYGMPTGEMIRGRQAIQEALDFSLLADLEVTGSARTEGADVVSEFGTYTQTIQPPEGEPMTVNGTYLVVLERQADGSWAIVQHLSSSPDAAQMPEAAPADSM